jgi:Transposase DDE domain
VEDTWNLRGQALRQAVGLAAQARGPSVAAVVEDAGLVLVGHRRLQAALALAGGEPRARERALALVREEVARGQRGLEQPQTLAAAPPPLQEARETITQMLPQDTEPDPGGGPGGRRLTQPVAPDRRLALEDNARRPGRTSRAKTFHGFPEPWAVAVDSTVLREGVSRPAQEPEPEAVALRAAALENAPGLLQLASALGSMASPRMAPWAAPGVSLLARPWPPGGPLCTKPDCTLDCAGRQGTCPGGQSVPMVRGQPAQFPAVACDVCAWRTQGTQATHGPGRSLRIREDEPFQQQLRAKRQTQRGRASLRKRTAVEHAMAQQLAHQGRRARYQGLRKNPCDGRRQAAVSNLQVAAHDEEEHRLAS